MRQHFFTLLVATFLLSLSGLKAQNCISGTVYEDINNNAIQDVGEAGLSGLTVELNWPDESTTTITTGPAGTYEFCNLITGDYSMQIINLQDGTISNPVNYTFSYVAGENLEPFDFAILNLSDFGTAIALVFYDNNRNGQHDNNEAVVENHRLTLSLPVGGLTLPTSPYGIAEFNNLPAGSYDMVSIGVIPANTAFANGGSTSFEIGAGQVVQLLFPIQNLDGFGAIQDYVCYDVDANGQNDPLTEPGIYGQTLVSLFNEQGDEIGTSQTDPNGRYGFMGISPDNYTVQFNYDDTRLLPTTPTNYSLDLAGNTVANPGPFYADPIRRLFECGMSMSTFGSEASNDQVFSVKDVRDRTSVVPSVAGESWLAPDLSLPNWDDNHLGEVFGIAADEAYNVYLTAALIPTYSFNFSISSGDPVVYHIDPYTGGESPLCYASSTATVPGFNTIFNNNRGIGNICSNGAGILFLTNISDGTIVAIGDADHPTPGEVLQVYNITSFTASSISNHTVWGIGYSNDRVYFSSPTTGGVQVYSIDAAGGILSGPEIPEATIGNVPVADIAFTDDGTKMLVAERGSAHGSKVYHYSGASTTWAFTNFIYVGAHGNGSNSSGGVDYAYESFDGAEPLSTDCETFIAASGNALSLVNPNRIYGFALLPITGNIAPASGHTPPSFANINSFLIDNDVLLTEWAKGYQGDVEIFDCDCPIEPIEDCSVSHGLEILGNSPLEPTGVGDCCHILDFNNTGNFDVYGISLSMLDGVQFQPGYQIAPGFYAPNFSSSSVTITPNALGTMPTNIGSMFNFCLENIHSVPQFMIIDYLDADYQVFCTDTLVFECPLQAECLEFTLDSLVCDTLGYKYTVDFTVPPGTDFDIGYIKFNLGQALPPGSYVEPIGLNADPANSGHTFSPALMPGDVVSLMYMIHTSDVLFGDSLCVIITAHDDLEERLCCFAYDACIPYPDCPIPCDEVEANVIPNYQGEAAECCAGDPRDYGWLQDLIGDCTALPCGAVVSCCEYQGQRVIVIEDDAELCSDPFGIVYDCSGGILFQFGGIGAINLDLYQQLSGCRVIYDCYAPAADECCYDLLITDTYTFDPALITAVQTTIITPGVTFTGQSQLNAILNGWTPNNLVVDQDILWTHNSGMTPNGIDDYLFTFCIEGTVSTDSVYIEVDWLNQDSVVCQDTVAVFCPYCLQVVNDSLSCITDATGNQSYLYQFSFVNSSAFDVNAVYIGDTSSPNDTILNPGIQMLGTTVPPGATYNGLIPVQIDSSLDSACFDIVLRQIIGDSINIACCYATHCIELPPCDELPQIDCPDQGQIQQIDCIDLWDPVCGCDGQTYSNSCYARNAGVVLWTDGSCDDLSNPGGSIDLGGQIVDEGAQLNWSINDDPANYSFFVVLRRGIDETSYQQLGIIPATDNLQYGYLDLNASSGMNSYQIIGALANGLVSPSNQIELFITEMLAVQTRVYAFPSPAIETIHVTVNKVGNAQLELISPDGQVHFAEQANFNGTPHPVNVGQLMDGVFIVRLRFNDGKTAQRRIVKMGL